MNRKLSRWLGSFIILMVTAFSASGCNITAPKDTSAAEADLTQSSAYKETVQIETIQDETSQKETVQEARTQEGQQPVKIALIDTGIERSAVNSDNILDGWNYCTASDDTVDMIGHGTSLAGLILGSETAGLEGGAPDSYIVPLVCQTKDAQGNTVGIEPQKLADIIVDAVDVYECDIINISSGVKTDYDELGRAVEYVVEKGVLIVSAAGNEGNSDVYYPGGYEGVLCVGSADESMTGRADFSQNNGTVDLLAPGEKVEVVTMKGNTIKVSGTSYSTAYVTAVAARLWKNNLGLTAGEIIELIMDNSIETVDGRVLY